MPRGLTLGSSDGLMARPAAWCGLGVGRTTLCPLGTRRRTRAVLRRALLRPGIEPQPPRAGGGPPGTRPPRPGLPALCRPGMVRRSGTIPPRGRLGRPTRPRHRPSLGNAS